MSHMVKLKLKINSLESLKKIVEQLGYVFCEGQTKAKYYGGNTAKCSHVIKVPGTNHEIAIIDNEDGTYTLQADFYGIEGKVLKEAYEKIEQLYTVEVTASAARRKGMSVLESWTLDRNTCELRIRV